MEKTYIGYARVSTEEQNTARQLHSFEGYTEKIKKVFIDKMSGKDTNRPELQAMLNYVCEGDVVVVSEFFDLAITSSIDKVFSKSIIFFTGNWYVPSIWTFLLDGIWFCS